MFALAVTFGLLAAGLAYIGSVTGTGVFAAIAVVCLVANAFPDDSKRDTKESK